MARSWGGTARTCRSSTASSRAATCCAVSCAPASGRAWSGRIPLAQPTSIGGETYGIGTVETTFPLGLPQEFGLEGAVFADVGTLFGAPEKNELDPECTDGVCNVYGKNPAIRASVGAGLIWDSPFGPLRLDVAWPVVKESYDKTELVRFSVGTRF